MPPNPPRKRVARAMQIPPLFQKYVDPPPRNHRYATVKGVFKVRVQTPPPKFSDFFLSEGKEVERKRKKLKGMGGGNC